MQQHSSFSSIPFRGTAFSSMVSDIDTRSAPLSVRYGLVAGAQSTGASNVFVGAFAGRNASPEGTVALGCYSGEMSSGNRLVLVGTEAGRAASGDDSIVVGSFSGMVLSGRESVVVGTHAARDAVFAGGGLVALGARAGAHATSLPAANCDTLLGYACAEGAQSLQGSNVLVGALVAGASTGLLESVVLGFGAAYAASNLLRSVVVGVGAGPTVGGSDNVVIGAGSAPAMLATGSCNVVIGRGADTVTASTVDSVSIGRDTTAGDRSVSLGLSVVTRRYNSTSIGSDINSVSDNAVTIGGHLMVNAVTVFADALTEYARPVFTATGVSNAMYNLAAGGFGPTYATLGPGYANVANVNTSGLYLNSVQSDDIRLMLPPFVIEVGTTVFLADNAAVDTGVYTINSAIGDLRVSDANMVSGTSLTTSGLLSVRYTGAPDNVNGSITAYASEPLVTSFVSATFALPESVVGAACASNLTWTAGSTFAWNAYLAKYLAKPQTTSNHLMIDVTPFSQAASIASASLDVGLTPGGITGGSLELLVTSAPVYGRITANAMLSPGATGVAYAPFAYQLPPAGQDDIALRAAHYPAVGGVDRAVLATADTMVHMVFAPAAFLPNTIPLISDGLTMGGVGCHAMYLQANAIPALTTVTVAVGSASVNVIGVGGNVGWGWAPPADATPAFALAASSLTILTFAPFPPVSARFYVSDALTSAVAPFPSSCNVVITGAPTHGYVTTTTTTTTGGSLLPGVSFNSGLLKMSDVTYETLDALAAPEVEVMTQVANALGSTGNASVRTNLTFDKSPFVHARDFAMATDFGGTVISTVYLNDVYETAPGVSFPASNVTLYAGALAGGTMTLLTAPQATFTITTSNLAVTSNYTSFVTRRTYPSTNASLGCNVTVFTPMIVGSVAGTTLPSSNLASFASPSVVRSDGLVIVDAYNLVYVATPTGRVESTTCYVASEEVSYASLDVSDVYYALSSGNVLYTSNYALRPPSTPVVRPLAPSATFYRGTSNAACYTSNAYWYDYRPLAVDHVAAYPDAADAFVVSRATPSTPSTSNVCDFLHVVRGHGLNGFSFSTADVDAGRVFVRPRSIGASNAHIEQSSYTRTTITYANGASNVLRAFYVPTLSSQSSPIVLPTVTQNAMSPQPPSLLPFETAMPGAWAWGENAELFVQPAPGVAGRSGYFTNTSDVGDPPFPDLSATVSTPLHYRHGRTMNLTNGQTFKVFAAIGSDANGWTATRQYVLSQPVMVTRNAGVPYNGGLTMGPQIVNADALSLPLGGRLTVDALTTGLSFRDASTNAPVSSFIPGVDQVAVSVVDACAVPGKTLTATLTCMVTNAVATVTVVPYRCDEVPGDDDATGTDPLTLAFHHEGATSSNAVDPRLMLYANNACIEGAPKLATTATMVIVSPPMCGYLTLDGGASTLMEVPMSRFAELQYVSISGGSNDVARVRFSHEPGGIGARIYPLAIKHYVYTSTGALCASNIAGFGTEQKSIGYMMDTVNAVEPARIITSVSYPPVSMWRSCVELTSSPPSSFAYVVDRADCVSLGAGTPSLLVAFAFNKTQASHLRFVLVTNPVRGFVALVGANHHLTPVRFFTTDDVLAGRAVYQHDGSAPQLDPDRLVFCVASHDYDVDSTTRYTMTFSAQALPTVVANAVEMVYGAPHAMSPVFLAATTVVTTAATAPCYHVPASTGINGMPSRFTENAYPTALTFPGGPSTASFCFQATNNATPNGLLTFPRWQPLLTQPHYFGTGVVSSSNVIYDSTRVRYLSYGVASGVFAGRVVTMNVNVKSFSDLSPTDPLAVAVASLSLSPRYGFVIRFASAPLTLNADGSPNILAGAICVLTFAPKQSTVTVHAPQLLGTPVGVPFALPRGALLAAIGSTTWTLIAVQNETSNGGGFYVTVGGVEVPTPGIGVIDFTDVTVVEVVYDAVLNEAADVVSADVSGLTVRIVKPLVALLAKDFSVSVSSYDASTIVSTGVTGSDIHNVVVGQNISVNGVNNIAIGQAFSTSGDGSIVLGTNIGDVNAMVTSLYQCIIIGKDMFSASTVNNVIAVGRRIMNDLASASVADVNAFVATGPIVIGNDITSVMLPYSINLGNSYLRGVDGRMYMGVTGEQVCVGFGASTVSAVAVASRNATTTTAACLVVDGGTLNSTGANAFPVSTTAPFSSEGPGWVASLTSTSATLSVEPASYFATDQVIGVTVCSSVSTSTAVLQASGIALVWVCSYGMASNVAAGALVCASPVAGYAVPQGSAYVTSATVGKLLQAFDPVTDSGAVTVGSTVDGGPYRASLLKCLLRLA